MKGFLKGFVAGLGVIAGYDIITKLVTEKRLNDKREEFYEKNGF